MALFYASGEEVRPGDAIRYHGDPGRVDFVTTAPCGDPAMDWYLQRFPGGGAMLEIRGWGRVFVNVADEDLEFVARS